jgi:hypothetical protein
LSAFPNGTPLPFRRFRAEERLACVRSENDETRAAFSSHLDFKERSTSGEGLDTSARHVTKRTDWRWVVGAGDPSKKDASAQPGTPQAAGSGGGGPTRREFLAGVGAAAAIAAGARTAAAATPGAVPGSLSPPLYRIHPAIGIARVGNADPSTFFVGPEVPGQPPLHDGTGTSVPNYKDSQGFVKPQAARFRIFEYGYVNQRLTPLREVTLDTTGVAAITWTAHLANKKASFYLAAGPGGDSTSGLTPLLPAAGLRNASVTNRRSLESDFGARSIAGRSQTPVEFRCGTSSNPSAESVVLGADGNPVISYLGQLRTDASGRLLVIGGQGKSASNLSPPAPLTTYANNDNWFDDVGDGPVTATVTLADGSQVQVDGTDPVSGKPWAGSAWVLVTPMKPAPAMKAAVTTYDLLFDVGVRFLPYPTENVLYDDGGPLAPLRLLQRDFIAGANPEFPTYVPDFATQIQPMLVNGYNYRWTTELVNQKMDSLMDPTLSDPSAAAAAARSGVYVYMRAPLGVPLGKGPQDMPRLRGDNPYGGKGQLTTSTTSAASPIRSLAVTHTQYALYRRWSDGYFTNSATAPPPPAITPHGLDRAALECCVGGAFYPGIEVGWQIRNPALYIEPFRLNPNATSQFLDVNGVAEGTPIGPGHFSRQQALPWQADYNDCATEGSYGWWPSARPTAVLLHPKDSLNARVDWARPDNRFPGGNVKSTHADMLQNWWKFGFVELDAASGTYIEKERAAHVP